MEKDKENIVIIGGGFAGIQLSKSLLKQNKEINVTLVDKNNYNFFPPLIYQVATGFLDVSNISYPFRKYFGKFSNFSFRMGELREIVHEQNLVVLNNGELPYSKLIIATGTTSNYFGNENIKKNSLPMKTISDALLLKNTILERFEEASRTTDLNMRRKLTNIVIAGGGPTGVEIAGMLSELKKNVFFREFPALRDLPLDIHLIDGLPTLLSPMSENSQRYAEKSLRNMGVKIRLGHLVKDYLDDTVILADGSVIPAKTLIWTAGVTGMTFAGLEPDDYGKGKRLFVDPFNRLYRYSNIYAIGDTCITTADPGFPYGHPQLAQVAMQQGSRLAKNLLLINNGEKPAPFIYKDKGSMAIISRNKAVADLPGTVRNLDGFVAWLAWIFVHLMSLVNIRNKLTTFLNWLQAYFTKDQPLRMIVKPGKAASHGE